VGPPAAAAGAGFRAPRSGSRILGAGHRIRAPEPLDRPAPSCIFWGVSSRPTPRDLRASDADRERVIALLNEAAGDGRLTLSEHSERVERAYSARTLGELAALTTDLAVASAQPIRLDGRKPIAGIFGRERRDGRWVVPDRLGVTAIFGEVVLDLREAVLQSRRITLLATVLGGTVQLIGHAEREAPGGNGGGAAGHAGDRGSHVLAGRPRQGGQAAQVTLARGAQSPSKLTAL